MDFSKLPKLSETKPEPGPETPQAPLPPPPREIMMGAEIWLCFAIGIILILVCHQPIEYLLTLNHPETFSGAVTDANNNPIPYPSSVFFLPQLGVCVFGFVLILDGLQMVLARSLGFAQVALGITIAGTLLNVAATISAFRNETGFLVCLFAVIFGGYTAIYQLNAVRRLRYLKRIGATINAVST